jgi:hypothetical protein
MTLQSGVQRFLRKAVPGFGEVINDSEEEDLLSRW